jgi:NADPH:quinone reductase-like Zn-dependent oxidoreductase
MLTKLIPNPFDGPRSPEVEFAGTTTVVGDGVRSELRQQGTQVFGMVHLESNLKRLWFQWRKGSLAEYVVAHQELVAIGPQNTNSGETAGLRGVG